jgi:hypothetical protein
VERKEARRARPWLSELDAPEWQELAGHRLGWREVLKSTYASEDEKKIALQCVVEASRGLAWTVTALVIELLGMHSKGNFQ